MGIKYSREYALIISEFAQALGRIGDICLLLEMDASDWDRLPAPQRIECIRTAADDLFYALGTEKEFTIGSAHVFLDEIHHRVCVRYADDTQAQIELLNRE